MENDLLELYRLETSFDGDPICTIHTVFPGECRREYTERWNMVEEIGAGAMGTVRSEREEITGRKRAVKSVYKPMLKGRMDYRRELLAMGILSKYSHAFVQFLGWYEDTHNLYLAMELFELGDLGKYLLSNGPRRPESECKAMGFQILRALEYMHRHEFTHRDLKPENIFVASTDPLHLKIGDFGITKRATLSTGLHTRAYTPHYAAPEVVLTSSTTSYTSKVDIWSTGCVLYKVLTGETPFKEPMEMYHFCTRTGDMGESEPARMLRRFGVEQEGVAFLLRLLKAKPEERPTASEARAMTWPKGWLDEVDAKAEVDTMMVMTKKELLRDLKMARKSRDDAVDKLREKEEQVKILEDAIAKQKVDLDYAKKAEVDARSQVREELQTRKSELQSAMAELLALKESMAKTRASEDDSTTNITIENLRRELEEQKTATAAAEHAGSLYQASMTAAQKSALEARNALTVALENHEAELAFLNRTRGNFTAQDERKVLDLNRQLASATLSLSAATKSEEKLRTQVKQISAEKAEALNRLNQAMQDNTRLSKDMEDQKQKMQAMEKRLLEAENGKNFKVDPTGPRLNTAPPNNNIPMSSFFRLGNISGGKKQNNVNNQPAPGNNALKPWRAKAPNFQAPKAKALYPFEAIEPDDLTFPEGATIIGITFPNNGWWAGWYNNKQGLFPYNYVELL